jgi:hypothetical protein
MSDAPGGGVSDATPKPSREPSDEPSSGSGDQWATKPPHHQARRKPNDHRGKPVTKADQADFEALKTLCEEVGQDDPVSVWWTLRKEHNAAKPSAFMARLVEYSEWDGFVGSHGIGEYQANGEAA